MFRDGQYCGRDGEEDPLFLPGAARTAVLLRRTEEIVRTQRAAAVRYYYSVPCHEIVSINICPEQPFRFSGGFVFLRSMYEYAQP